MTAVVGANALARVAAPLSQPSPQSVIRSPHPIKEQYIVVLTEDQDSEAMGREAENVHSGRLEHIYRHVLRGFAIRLSEAAAEQLARDPRVEFVEEDKVVHAIQAATTWGLDRIDQRLLPPDGVFNVAGTGSGVGVHVLDTGIRTGQSSSAAALTLAVTTLTTTSTAIRTTWQMTMAMTRRLTVSIATVMGRTWLEPSAVQPTV